MYKLFRSDKPSGNPSPLKNIEERIQTHLHLSIELIAMGAENNTNHLVD